MCLCVCVWGGGGGGIDERLHYGRPFGVVLRVLWISDELVIESLPTINIKPAQLHRRVVINVV